MGFQNIGPNYWKGEEGRQALIAGTEKFTDPPYVAVWEQLAHWAPTCRMATRHRPTRMRRASSRWARRHLSPPVRGKSAVSPAGRLRHGASSRRPCPKAHTCYISDHTDIAMGMNASHPQSEEAQDLPDLGCHPRIRRAVQQCAARLLLALQ